MQGPWGERTLHVSDVMLEGPTSGAEPSPIPSANPALALALAGRSWALFCGILLHKTRSHPLDISGPSEYHGAQGFPRAGGQNVWERSGSVLGKGRE